MPEKVESAIIIWSMVAIWCGIRTQDGLVHTPETAILIPTRSVTEHLTTRDGMVDTKLRQGAKSGDGCLEPSVDVHLYA